MLKDIIDCYADTLYLRATMHLPPRAHVGRAARPGEGSVAAPGLGVAPRHRRGLAHLAAVLRRHLARPALPAAAARYRGLRGNG